MTRQLKNISANVVTLADLQGVSIEPGQTIDGLQFGTEVLRNSNSVASALLAGTLVLLDNYTTYTGIAAVDLIRGSATQVTRDGKPIYTVSDRPKDTFRHFTSRGDDLVARKIGQGTRLAFDIAPGQTQSIDMQFIEDIYIKDGYATYGKSNSDDCTLSVGVWCPAGVPFPAPGGNTGNYDLIGSTWTANASGHGAYLILGTETHLFKFAVDLGLPTFNNIMEIESAEPQLIPSPYILRITLFNGADSSSNLKSYVHVGMYRPHTIN